ncbi:Rha family transcriptional regulator [Thalassospira sp. GO-4]|uniref:Rha family transcriptional regulator n=1 Tax=Thalassospira sp. GO-4 TaxID=2946605 RepID=UPI0020258482|nr:Rha family transcriptional regulator [Thalassospira sp. GO-4]URK16949.1 Rha family transcriptional regulator [Thalassospira sp. GO-4]
MSPCELITTPIVTIKNNEVFANSRDVAAYFGKKHFNVLQDIDKTIGALESQASPSDLFQEGSYYSPANERLHRCYDMTKDGFTLLAMSYTGKKAMQFKLRYMAEFNRMEAQLKAQAPALPDFSNPAEAARV